MIFLNSPQRRGVRNGVCIEWQYGFQPVDADGAEAKSSDVLMHILANDGCHIQVETVARQLLE